MTNRLPGSVPPDSKLLSTTAAAWARERLQGISEELRRLSDRALAACPGAQPIVGPTFGIHGLFKFHFDPEWAVLWVQFGDEPSDAIYFRTETGTFTRRNDPKSAVEPLGYLRGRLLEAVSGAGGARFTSMPPRSEVAVSVPVPQSPRVPKVD